MMLSLLLIEGEGMLRLEKVNGMNVWEILKLTVAENQKTMVRGDSHT